MMGKGMALGLAVLVAGCASPTDLGLAADFVRDGDVVRVDVSGRYAVRVVACVPGLASARATITEVERAADDGGTTSTTVTLVPGTVEGCDEGGLSATASLPVRANGAVRLEVAVLGERIPLEDEVAFLEIGSITGLTFTPGTIPAGGGLVQVTAELAGAQADIEGALVTFRTVPSVPLSSSSARVEEGESVARTILSIPPDVAELWVEATLGGERASSCISTSGTTACPM